MSAELPRILHVRSTLDGSALAGAWVRATLVVSRKNYFDLLIGPTNQEGEALITRDQMIDQVEATRNLLLMDYTGISYWTGVIRLVVMNAAGLSALLEAVELWGVSPGLEKKELAALRQFAEFLESRAGATLDVAAWTEPAEAAILETSVALA
jgi:hypothetical protein